METALANKQQLTSGRIIPIPEQPKSIPVSIDELEQVRANFLDPEYLVEQTYRLYRLDNKGKRLYVAVYEDGRILIAPGVTTVESTCGPMNYFLLKWFKDHTAEYCDWYSECSANYGTYFHILTDRLLRHEKIYLDRAWLDADLGAFYQQEGYNLVEGRRWLAHAERDTCKDIYGFLTWVRDYEISPVAIEYPIMDPDGLAAGTIDLVAWATFEEKEGRGKTAIITKKRKLIMVDKKSRLTGFYDTDGIQLRGYEPMWNKEHPELPIEELWSYCCKEYRLPVGSTVIPYQFKQQNNPVHAALWPLWLQAFHADPMNMTITPRTEFFGGEVSLETDLTAVFVEVDPLGALIEHEAACQETDKTEQARLL
jgi:hypothetical protein